MLTKQSMLEIIQFHIPSWQSLSSSSITITLLTGTSNKVYLLENSCSILPTSLIFREFGSSLITDKNRERVIFSALHQIAPQSLGVSNEYRIEEFLQDFEPMVFDDFCREPVMINVCNELKRFHNSNCSETLGENGPALKGYLQKWKDIALGKLEMITNEEGIYIASEILGDEAWGMYEELMPKGSQLVFSHLDPNLHNFLINRNDDSIKLIDYEFSGLSNRGTDLGMLLTELKFDFRLKSPPFFTYDAENSLPDPLIVKYIRAYGGDSEMLTEVKLFEILGYFIWAVWDLAMISPSNSGFDYLANARLRIIEFKKAYKEFINNGGFDGLQDYSKKLFAFI